eukprot:SAG11_NODE_153_length_14352_cov_24.348323_14_plen_239_part_00
MAFGEYAGRAGMINSFRGLGERMLALGYSTPFLSMGSAYQYPSLVQAKRSVAETGELIRAHGTPSDVGPLIFAITGGGNCSGGAQEVFAELGSAHEFISVTKLPEIVEAGRRGEADLHKVYGCVVEEEAMVASKHSSSSNNSFDRQHYYAHPECYRPTFHECKCTGRVSSVIWSSVVTASSESFRPALFGPAVHRSRPTPLRPAVHRSVASSRHHVIAHRSIAPSSHRSLAPIARSHR